MRYTLFSQQKNINIIVLLFIFLSLMIAYGAELAYDIKPCILCVYLRYLYWAVLAVSLFLIAYSKNCWLKVLQLLSVMAALGLSFYHVGVEQKWWYAPSFCQHSLEANPLNDKNLTAQEKIALIRQNIQNSSALVRCDRVNWRVLGVSVTIWNTLSLVGLITYLLIALVVQRRCLTKP